jgi:hypothetical protein
MDNNELQKLQKLAEDNQNLIRNAENAGEAVRAIFRSHDIVYGVFPIDAGVETLLIKGKWFVDNKCAPRKLTAMPCQDVEEAKALRNLFGDSSSA